MDMLAKPPLGTQLEMTVINNSIRIRLSMLVNSSAYMAPFACRFG